MPLEPGCDKAVISRNVAHMIAKGHPRDQAVAAAYENCRQSRKGKSLDCDELALIVPPAKPLSWLERKLKGIALEPGVYVRRAANNLRYMFLVSSNGYQDRPGDVVTTQALSGYVERAWVANDKCQTNNVHTFWHDEDNPIGDIIWTRMEGPFLLEVSKERRGTISHRGRLYPIAKVWDGIERNQKAWGASAGFWAWPHEIAARQYTTIVKVETATLPKWAAANPYTYSGVRNVVTKSAEDNKIRDTVLDQLLGIQGASKELVEGVKKTKAELDKLGKVYKDFQSKEVTPEQMADAILAMLQGEGTPEQKREKLVALLTEIASGNQQTDTPSPEDQAAQQAQGQTDMAAMMGKSLSALDIIVGAQADLLALVEKAVKDVHGEVATITGKVAAVETEVKTVKALADGVAAMEKQVKGMGEQLSRRPSRILESAQTVVDVKDDALVEAVRKQQEKLEAKNPDSFWPADAFKKD